MFHVIITYVARQKSAYVRMRANCLITQSPPLTPSLAGSNGSKSSVTLFLSALSVAILFAARGHDGQ